LFCILITFTGRQDQGTLTFSEP